MKLVIVSDLHLDWHTDGFERMADIKLALRPPIEKAKALAKQEPTAFVCLGDVTNPNSRNHHRAVQVVAETMRELGQEHIENLWLVGNHDVIEDGHQSHVLMGLQAVCGDSACTGAGFLHTQIISEPDVIVLGKKLVLCLPFTPSGFPYDPGYEVKRTDDVDAVFGHLSIEGILFTGSETEDMPRGRNLMFPIDACKKHLPKAKLFNGHYHRPQQFKGINIPGSLVRLTHGEETNQTGYMVADI